MEWLTFGMFTYPYNREESPPTYAQAEFLKVSALALSVHTIRIGHWFSRIFGYRRSPHICAAAIVWTAGIRPPPLRAQWRVRRFCVEGAPRSQNCPLETGECVLWVYLFLYYQRLVLNSLYNITVCVCVWERETHTHTHTHTHNHTQPHTHMYIHIHI